MSLEIKMFIWPRIMELNLWSWLGWQRTISHEFLKCGLKLRYQTADYFVFTGKQMMGPNVSFAGVLFVCGIILTTGLQPLSGAVPTPAPSQISNLKESEPLHRSSEACPPRPVNIQEPEIALCEPHRQFASHKCHGPVQIPLWHHRVCFYGGFLFWFLLFVLL